MTPTMPTGFPYNLVNALSGAFAPSATPGVSQIVQRRLRPTDDDGTLAIYSSQWKAGVYEVGGREVQDPTFAQHWLTIQFMNKIIGDQPLGQALAADMAKIIRRKLYRDTATEVALRACSETVDGITESVFRWRVAEQKYFDAPAPNSTFVYISTTTVWVETTTAG